MKLFFCIPWKIKSLSGLMVLTLCFLTIVSQAKQVHAANHRIILIDQSMFSLIPTRDERNQAIDFMLMDIERIENDPENVLPQIDQTYVYYVDEYGQITSLMHTLRQQPVHQSLEKSDFVRNLRARSNTSRTPFDPQQLAEALTRKSKQLGKTDGALDIHIFSDTWAIGTGHKDRQALADTTPAICVFQHTNQIAPFPPGIDMSVEIRPREGVPAPGRGMVSALLTILGNTGSPKDSLKFLGVKGPKCQTMDRTLPSAASSGVMIPRDDPDIDLDCDREMSDVFLSRESVTICPGLKMVPNQGGVDRRPVHLMTRDLKAAASDVKVTSLGPPPANHRLEIVIAGRAISMNGTSALPPGTHLGTASLTPGPSCQTGQDTAAGLAMDLNGAGRLTLSTGPLDCQTANLILGTVRIR